MNSKEKSMIVEVLERIARIEERGKHTLETLKEIKTHMETINSEMGELDSRVGKIENLYFEAKARYEKMSLYWKVIAFVLSPIVTYLIATYILPLF